MHRLQSYATLGLSLVIFSLALIASAAGSRHDGLYATPGRIDVRPAAVSSPLSR